MLYFHQKQRSTSISIMSFLTFSTVLSLSAVGILANEDAVEPHGHLRSLSSTSKVLNKAPLNLLRNVYDVPVQPSDRGLMWMIPRTGGTYLKELMHTCLYTNNFDNGMTGQRSRVEYEDIQRGSPSHANIGHGTPPSEAGLQAARDSINLGLFRTNDSINNGDESYVHVFNSFFLYEAASIFDSDNHGGRVFALFRHPIERQVSLYHRVKDARWQGTHHPEIAQMSLMEYVTSPLVNSNWMVRYLTNKRSGMITKWDLADAKQVIMEKVLVLLSDRMDDSIDRLAKYMDWNKREDYDECIKSFDDAGTKSMQDYPDVIEGSDEWKELEKLNIFDLELYEYIKGLFEMQGTMLENKLDPVES